MPSTFSRPCGTPPGVRKTDKGRWQAYANYRDAAGCKSFRSLGTFDTVGEAVRARTLFTLAQSLPLLKLMVDDQIADR